jgi:hypothetical protein
MSIRPFIFPSITERGLYRVRSSTSSFNLQYPLFYLKECISCWLPLCLPVMSIPSFIFPPITYFRMQFLRKLSPIQLFIRSIACRIFLSYLTLCKTSSMERDRSKYSPSNLPSTTFQNLSDIYLMRAIPLCYNTQLYLLPSKHTTYDINN